MRRWLAGVMLCIGMGAPAQADELLFTRIARPFPEAIASLQEAIRNNGYTVSRVQRVDVGLTASGFQTAEYRIVFFGKADEVRRLSTAYPELIPYLPLNIVMFAEGDDTLLLTTSPLKLAEFFDKPELRAQFARWEKDVRVIINGAAQAP